MESWRKKMNEFGLPDYVFDRIIEVLRRYPAIKSAKIFGSRAKGNYKRYSDVDIAIFADGDRDLSANVKDALEDLYVIYKFDVAQYDKIGNPEMREHIDRVGLEILRIVEAGVENETVESG